LGGLAAADGGEDGDFVAVGKVSGGSVDGFVAVDPDPRVVEHRAELGTVRAARGVEELGERGAVELVVGATGRFPCLREQT
jgi:hypothetical protein